MKAARIYGPKDIRIVEIDRPEISDYEVLVKVKAVGLCGTDVELFEGTMPYLKNGLTTLPITPGHEWSGIIEEVGARVKKFKVGDRVTGDVSLGCGCCDYCKEGRYNLCPNRRVVGSYKNKDGGMAEYIVMPERYLYILPENISFEEGALIESTATCIYGIRRTNIQLGETVLIIGDGPIGLLSAQVAYRSGASKVIISGSYNEKLIIAQKTADADIINRHDENVVEKVKKITLDQGADVVIEACGNKSGLDQAIELVKPGGRICLLSIYTKDLLNIAINKVIFKDLEVIGSLASPNSFQSAINMLSENLINTKKVISHSISLDNVSKAFDLIYNKRNEVVKIILKP